MKASLLSLLSVVLLVQGVQGISYIPVPDEDLLSHAEVVFEATVVDLVREYAHGRTRAYSQYHVRVEDVIKSKACAEALSLGAEDHHEPLVKGEIVTVITHGASDLEKDIHMQVPGIPHFESGERLLLFAHYHHELNGQKITDNVTEVLPLHNHDQSKRILTVSHAALGAFRERIVLGADRSRNADSVKLAVNDLADPHLTGGMRDFDAFSLYLKGVMASRASPGKRSVPAPNYFKTGIHFNQTEKVARESRRYTQLGNARWCNFATAPAIWYAEPGGMPNNDPVMTYTAGTIPNIDAAFQIFVNEPTSVINYVRQVPATFTYYAGLASSDGVNAIIWQDPNNEISPTVFPCGSGGTLAIGGFYNYGSTCNFNGRAYNQIFEGNMVMQDGLGCSGYTALFHETVYAHEFGHTLAFGHSAVTGALMYPSIQCGGSCTGAFIHADEVAIMQLLYAGACTPPTCGANSCGVITNACGSIDCGNPTTTANVCGPNRPAGDYTCVNNQCACVTNPPCPAGFCGTYQTSCSTPKTCSCPNSDWQCTANSCQCKALTCGTGFCGTRTSTCTPPASTSSTSLNCATNCVSPDTCNTGTSTCQACVPLTCGANDCGAKPNGCGGTLNCGTCSNGRVCNGQFQCECPAVQCLTGECGVKTSPCGAASATCSPCVQDATCTSNVCVCNTPSCGTKTCNQVTNACGNTQVCGFGNMCPNGQFCNATDHCDCPAPTCGAGDCGLKTNACGKSTNCGNPCTGQDTCVSGRCTCQPRVAPGGCPANSCGQVADGCNTGGTIACGACAGAQDMCVGGQCVCQPRTCQQLGKQCGTHANGCGGTITCGPCVSPTTECFSDTTCVEPGCTPVQSCAAAGKSCGTHQTTCQQNGSPLTLDCGTCGTNQSCTNNQCVCDISNSCGSLQASCGNIDTGCGMIGNCGMCNIAGQACVNNKCQCVPLATCPDPATFCGDYPDGCGGVISCGGCLFLHDICNPITGRCDCTPHNCDEHGWTCGSHSDGCGGVIECGTCSNTTHYCQGNANCLLRDCAPVETCDSRQDKCGVFSTICNVTNVPLTIDCGFCRGGKVCSPGQVRQDGTQSMACICAGGETCTQANRECGVLVNGCGDSIDCGSCFNGLSCVSGRCQIPDRCFGVTCTPPSTCRGGACICESPNKFDPQTFECVSPASEVTDAASSLAVSIAVLLASVALMMM